LLTQAAYLFHTYWFNIHSKIGSAIIFVGNKRGKVDLVYTMKAHRNVEVSFTHSPRH